MNFVNAYNFIPLNSGEEKKKYADHTVKEQLLTGKIKCRLVTKTELLIPDHELGKPGDKETKTPGDYPFMTIKKMVDGKEVKKPMIPGSSLRGMFRNAFEAITDSCVFTNDDYYFSSRTGKPKTAGLIEKTDMGWKLYKAARYGEGNKNRDGYIDFIGGYETGDIVYVQGDEDSKIKNRFYLTDIKKDNTDGYKLGYVLKMNSLIKGSGQGVFIKNSFVTEFSKDDIQIKAFKDNISKYLDGESEKLEAEKLAKLYNKKFENLNTGEMIPVWYDEYKGKYYLALSQMSRNVYTNKPKNIIEKKHPNLSKCGRSDKLCPACALFGFITDEKEDFSAGSRVRFSDANCEDESVLSAKKVLLPILGNPRSSSLEFYLRGTGNFWHADYDGVELSGRKFYWHHNSFNIDKLVGPDSDKRHMTSRMQYVNSGASFDFCVYFEGITKSQLNQLYSAVTYGDTETGAFCHKLGHGKPFGFGSVKVVADEVCIRSFADGHYEENKNYLKELRAVDISREIKRIIDFNAIDNKKTKIDYPRYRGNGDIFKWFSENRPMSGDPKYYITLPKISDFEHDQTISDDPKVPPQNRTNNLSPKPDTKLPNGDIYKICRDCGDSFLFTVGEQEFYKEKNIPNHPKSCKKCRDKRKPGK